MLFENKECANKITLKGGFRSIYNENVMYTKFCRIFQSFDRLKEAMTFLQATKKHSKQLHGYRRIIVFYIKKVTNKHRVFLRGEEYNMEYKINYKIQNKMNAPEQSDVSLDGEIGKRFDPFFFTVFI